jgi:succinoglycan biosynthesis transport protein ExoP
MHEYDVEAEEASVAAGPSLPFDIITFLLGIWRRRMVLLIAAILSVVIGYVMATIFSTREYEATALLLYDPPVLDDESDGASQLSLNTLVDLFKTRQNLEDVRKKLQLTAKVKAIGNSTTIELRRKTTLLEIRTRWDDADQAANIANAIYECFFKRLTTLQGKKRGQALENLSNRLREVSEELEIRDQELKQFTLENRIVDLDKEAAWYLQQLVTLNTESDRATSRLESARQQRVEIGLIIDKLKKAAEEETDTMSAQMSSVTESNIKIQRLRELIGDEQESRARLADLAVKEEDLKRAKNLRELDAISQSEYDRIVAEHERVKAMTYDSEQITQWKQEIEQLDKAVVPTGGSMSTLSGDVMRSVMLKAIDIQLEETASREQVKSLEKAKKRTEARLATIPQVKQAHAERERRVEALVAERKTLQNMIATTNRQLKSSQIPFRVVSKAEKAFYPRKSNRKLIFIGILFVGIAASGILVVMLELLDFTIKSQGSLKAALAATPLAILPRLKDEEALLPGPQQPTTHVESYRHLALALRRAVPDSGRSILLTGTSPGIGTTIVTLNLATLLQLKGERVMIIDGHTQPHDSNEQSISIADYVDADPTTLTGLGDYLTSETLAPEDLPYVLDTIGSKGIVCARQRITPELLSSQRMKELMEQLRSQFSLILIDAPSLSASVNAEYLAGYADGIIYVVRSGQSNILAEKKSFRRIEETGTRIIGTVLTDVHNLYVRT